MTWIRWSSRCSWSMVMNYDHWIKLKFWTICNQHWSFQSDHPDMPHYCSAISWTRSFSKTGQQMQQLYIYIYKIFNIWHNKIIDWKEYTPEYWRPDSPPHSSADQTELLKCLHCPVKHSMPQKLTNRGERNNASNVSNFTSFPNITKE